MPNSSKPDAAARRPFWDARRLWSGCVGGVLAGLLWASPALAWSLGAWPLGPWPFGAHQTPRLTHSHVVVGDWRLDMVRNGFSGAVACRLHTRDGRAFYVSGAVGFRFAPGWDVGEAVYRLDGAASSGGPRRTRDDLPDLIAQGVPVDRGAPGNAARGIVWVPYALAAAASQIAIEPRPDLRVHHFHYSGLRSLHDMGVARGCAPEGRFVE